MILRKETAVTAFFKLVRFSIALSSSIRVRGIDECQSLVIQGCLSAVAALYLSDGLNEHNLLKRLIADSENRSENFQKSNVFF